MPTQITQIKRNNLWGILLAENVDIFNVELWKIDPHIIIGSGAGSHIVLSSNRLSQVHCLLSWDGKNNAESLVKVTDQSDNGTYINGVKIGAGRTAVLRHWDEIAFDLENSEGVIYRYTFFLMAAFRTYDIFNVYDITCRLGRGAFGTVVLGVNMKSGVSKHAIKMIDKVHFKTYNKEEKKSFLRDLSVLKMANHPNICGFLKYINTRERLYIILEYVEGGNLETFTEARPRLSEKLSHHLSLQMTKAISYLHLHGIVHCNIKPENVLLTKDKLPNVKLAGFGLSNSIGTMRQLKVLCGTSFYVAPEVLLRPASEGHTHLVDSWALGVIVFKLLTKLYPFKIVEDSDTDDLILANLLRKFYPFKNDDSILADVRQNIDWTRLESAGVSGNAVSFVKRLIVWNESKRMSVTDALSHPWFKNKV